jgi:5-(carboxyamino)imidazole ribonucleotide mutase
MEYDENLVVMCAGSTSDKEWIEKIGTHLNKVGLNGIVLYGSAHKNTSFVLNRLQNLYKNNENRKLVFVTVAGRSNALSGVVACNVSSPVIACPPFKDKDDMMVNINSTLVMPSDVPTMTILEPRNVALSVKRIFNTM